MALPARLKSTLRPLGAVGKSISPTGICVLLSVGAHVLLIAAGAQGSSGSSGGGGGLFDKFDEASAEKIVPIMQLTPAERSRLPAFAQPRPDPLSSSSLSSLDLPPGLLAPNAAFGQGRTSLPAGRMPSATTSRQFAATPPIDDVLRQLKARVAAAPTRPQTPLSINIPRRTPTAAYIQPESSVIVPPLPTGNTNGSTTVLPAGSAADLGKPDSSGLPQLESQSTQDILARLQGEGQPATTPEKTPTTSAGENNGEPPETPSETNASGNGGVEAPPENNGSDKIATLTPDPADGDAAELQDDLTYDSRLTADEAVAEKVASWTEAVVAAKGTLPLVEIQVPIKAALKACRTNPPIDGLIGVIVNPGGEIETTDILRSTGYETLNLRAQKAIKNYDFSNVDKTTDYRVTVKVNYDEDGCVDIEGLKERLIN